ncbi:MAG: hypothetical protein FD187_1819 [bacterium]|nr:MAG: hypothetical protein FD142_1144 [bacterium]KAF0148630.1 MAG: hypothetical protein FD187_1819 [bacterium]KAF0167934.1 MAG: hypothetical protein FD158_1829 [bacterium]TXT17333.1 MAG: hypothetical protein FD132_2483 [bacterium]
MIKTHPPESQPGVAVHLVAVLLLPWALSVQADSDYIKKSTAAARPSAMLSVAGKPDRIDFNFFDSQAWVMPNGDWQARGRVSHRGMLCGTYELGMRFGVGSSGCNDVQWLGEPVYVTSQNHCNSATEFHQGGDSQPELKEDFARITCAERLIRCSGNCK